MIDDWTDPMWLDHVDESTFVLSSPFPIADRSKNSSVLDNP